MQHFIYFCKTYSIQHIFIQQAHSCFYSLVTDSVTLRGLFNFAWAFLWYIQDKFWEPLKIRSDFVLRFISVYDARFADALVVRYDSPMNHRLWLILYTRSFHRAQLFWTRSTKNCFRIGPGWGGRTVLEYSEIKQVRFSIRTFRPLLTIKVQ